MCGLWILILNIAALEFMRLQLLQHHHSKWSALCSVPRPRIYRPRTPDFLLSFSCFIQQLLMSLINLSGKFKFKAMIWTHWQPPYRRRCWASIFKGVLGLLIRCLWSKHLSDLVNNVGRHGAQGAMLKRQWFTHLSWAANLLTYFKSQSANCLNQ